MQLGDSVAMQMLGVGFKSAQDFILDIQPSLRD